MPKDWNLRQEIYTLFHRWPAILASFAIGCLIGWAAAFILPSSYRSTTLIHVGLNPYRTFEDTTFQALARPKYSNVDDYNHWQMSQLESVIYLNNFIEGTLTVLQNEDPYWKDISSTQLREILDADWRSAGTWSLIADHTNPVYARQASQAWSEVITTNVISAVQSARDTFIIDQELQGVTRELILSKTRYEHLISVNDYLSDWKQTTTSLPEKQSLDPVDRWQILLLVSQAAQFTPAWETLLSNQPPSDAPIPSYLDWIDQVTANIDVEVSILQQQIYSLGKTRKLLAEEYANLADASLGLSPNIAIEGKETVATQVIRPASRLALVGGIVGLCAWLFYQLAKISRREPDSESLA